MSSIRWSVPPHVRLEETGDAVLILDATRGGVHRLVGPSALVIRAAMSPEGAAGLTGEELAAAEALETEGLLVRSGGREISRRTALTAGAAAALGITTLMLPAAAVAASVEPLERDVTEDIAGVSYSFWVFTSRGTTTFVADGVPSGDEVDVLVVGGGGGGAGGALVTRTNGDGTTQTRVGHGGGGGAGGGFKEATLALSGGVPVTVGSGGTGGLAGDDNGTPDADEEAGATTYKVYFGQDGADGTDSVFGSGTDSVTAGGGSGGKAAGLPVTFNTTSPSSPAEWEAGAAPGGVGVGGGGDGGDGGGRNAGGQGGEPANWFDQDGSVVAVSGGGGGGEVPNTDGGGDGVDGGGDGGGKGGVGKDAAPNRGGGGGGGAGSEQPPTGSDNAPATDGGDGGDGIVIVRYPSIPAPDPV